MKVCKKIENLDSFGQPVQLNFNGHDKYVTTRGGIITILTYIMAAILGSELIMRWYNQEDPVISTYETGGTSEDKFNFIDQK